MSTKKFEQQVAEALDAPCGCVKQVRGAGMDGINPLRLRDCPICLPKRVAAAIEAATWSDQGAGLAALRGEERP